MRLAPPLAAGPVSAKHALQMDFYGEAFARWLREQNGGRPVRFEKVQPGDEQILPEREQREVDALPSALDPAAWTSG